MLPFKIGDRIICVNPKKDSTLLLKGDTGIVIDIYEDRTDIFVHFKFDKMNQSREYFASRFILLSEAPPEMKFKKIISKIKEIDSKWIKIQAKKGNAYALRCL